MNMQNIIWFITSLLKCKQTSNVWLCDIINVLNNKIPYHWPSFPTGIDISWLIRSEEKENISVIKENSIKNAMHQ